MKCYGAFVLNDTNDLFCDYKLVKEDYMSCIQYMYHISYVLANPYIMICTSTILFKCSIIYVLLTM